MFPVNRFFLVRYYSPVTIPLPRRFHFWGFLPSDRLFPIQPNFIVSASLGRQQVSNIVSVLPSILVLGAIFIWCRWGHDIAVQVATGSQAQALRDRWLGRRSGLLAGANERWLKAAPRDLKPAVGKLQNRLKRELEAAVRDLLRETKGRAAAVPALDPTLPGPQRAVGARHPVRMALEDVLDIFRPLGYSVAEGPEIESFFNNFEALNFPADHPAVDEMDTLFLDDRVLLRTHTSPCQIRIMQAEQPPLRYVVHGKVYRNDTPDATHLSLIHL